MYGEVEIVEDVPRAFAARVIDAFIDRPDATFSLAVSGGGTARRCYQRLALDGAEAIDWWAVDLFWGDERCVHPDSDASNERLVREALLERIGAANEVHPMRCDEGPEAYQLKISTLPAIDVIHLGMGPDGHTASLFPNSPGLDADPGRLVVMNDDPGGRNPHPRMTLTFAGIARARLALVTVAGDTKRHALAQVRAGDPDCPGSHINADRVVWIADRAATG